MRKILEGPTNFIFDKPQYEVGMKLGTGLFSAAPVWVKLPGLGFQYWTRNILTKLLSKVGKPLMVDSPTINRTRLGSPGVLVVLHSAANLVKEVKF